MEFPFKKKRVKFSVLASSQARYATGIASVRYFFPIALSNAIFLPMQINNFLLLTICPSVCWMWTAGSPWGSRSTALSLNQTGLYYIRAGPCCIWWKGRGGGGLAPACQGRGPGLFSSGQSSQIVSPWSGLYKCKCYWASIRGLGRRGPYVNIL